MTYHDCQGQTCRKVLLGNISRLFSTNMLYVGLSRAPSLDCVVLSDDFSQHHIKQDEDAISFFQQLHALSRPPEEPSLLADAVLIGSSQDEATPDESSSAEDCLIEDTKSASRPTSPLI